MTAIHWSPFYSAPQGKGALNRDLMVLIKRPFLDTRSTACGRPTGASRMDLTTNLIVRTTLPHDWQEQAKALGL